MRNPSQFRFLPGFRPLYFAKSHATVKKKKLEKAKKSTNIGGDYPPLSGLGGRVPRVVQPLYLASHFLIYQFSRLLHEVIKIWTGSRKNKSIFRLNDCRIYNRNIFVQCMKRVPPRNHSSQKYSEYLFKTLTYIILT